MATSHLCPRCAPWHDAAGEAAQLSVEPTTEHGDIDPPLGLVRGSGL